MIWYIFIIGSADDLDSVGELREKFDSDDLGDTNHQVFSFKANEHTSPFNLEMIGMGLAFAAGWSEPHTHYFLTKPKVFEVSVGNIGCLTFPSKNAAEVAFEEYVAMSKKGYGMVGGESVCLLVDGEPVKEYIGEMT